MYSNLCTDIRYYSNTLLSPFAIFWKFTSSNSPPVPPICVSSPFTSALASFNASCTVQTFRRKNQDINPPPFFTSSCVATQYFACSIRCARTPFFAPRFNCCAAEIETSCSPCKNARVRSGGSAFAIGLSAAAVMPCGVYTTHSAASVLVFDASSAPSPYIDKEERFLGEVCDWNGRVANVIKRAE